MSGLILLLAGVAAGFVNAIAGGGANITFPAMLYCGVNPVIASSTNIVALWAGQVVSVVETRHQLAKVSRSWFWLGLPCVIGGLIGGYLLLSSPEDLFGLIVPWLVIFSTCLLTWDSKVRSWLKLEDEAARSRRLKALALIVMFFISIISGYYRAGMGVFLLAYVSILGVDSMYTAVALKNLYAILIHVGAIIYFLLNGGFELQGGLLVMAGSMLGGFMGARSAKYIPKNVVKCAVAAIGFTLAAVLFYKNYFVS